MGHAARISLLVGELVASITSRNHDDIWSRRIRDRAVATFRNSSHARTNQFDVQSKLEGLIEKFAILNRDDLCNALQARVDELPADSKWNPEILSLLLQLSDRPLDKTNVADVEVLTKSSDNDPPALTWAEIVADIPLDEAEIWDDVDRGYHSSGDDATVDGEVESDDTGSTRATSVGEDDVVALARVHLQYPDADALQDLRKFRSWHPEDRPNTMISELSLIRESLTMLHGLPTRIYDVDVSTGKVSYTSKFTLDTATRFVIHQALQSFSETGSALNALRHWVRSEQSVTYIRSCQAALLELIMDFGTQLTGIERSHISPKVSLVASITRIWKETELQARPLVHLSNLVQSSREQLSSQPHILLNVLYNEACSAQMSDDTFLFTSLTRILYAGSSTYLRPVSTWMATGSVAVPDGTFFIIDSNSNCEPGSMWQDRFGLRTLDNGEPAVPSFMQNLTSYIFSVGKSRAFLRALNERKSATAEEPSLTSPHPDFCTIQERLQKDGLLPFSQIFDDVLRSWTTKAARDCTPLLCKSLLYDHGLLKTIDELGRAFCSQDGRLFQSFAETLFWRMDHNRNSWRDRFLLNELAISTLGSADDDDAAMLSVVLQNDGEKALHGSSIRQLEAIVLEKVLAWPVQNIAHCRSSSTYSRAFAFLLQVYRAEYLLRQQFFGLRSFDSPTSQVPQQLASALRLRQRLLSTVAILQAHLTNTLRALRIQLRNDVENADDIDSMATAWKRCHALIETNLVLSQNLATLRDALTNVLELSEQFSQVWKNVVRGTGRRDDDKTSVQSDYDSDNSEDPSAIRLSVSRLHHELTQSLSFVIAGLRNIGRVRGNAALEELAERLQWSIQ